MFDRLFCFVLRFQRVENKPRKALHQPIWYISGTETGSKMESLDSKQCFRDQTDGVSANVTEKNQRP